MVAVEFFFFLNKYTFKNTQLGKNTKEHKFEMDKDSWFWKDSTGGMGRRGKQLVFTKEEKMYVSTQEEIE